MSCGVCCTGDATEHAAVTGDDWSRIDEGALGDDADHWAVFSANHAFMRMHEGHCSALVFRGSLGGTGFSCAIYARRPAVCRALDRDSPACEGEIARKGDEVRRRLPVWRLPPLAT